MERPPVGMDELVEHWTVLCGEQDLIETKHGATRLGFTLVIPPAHRIRLMGGLAVAASGCRLESVDRHGWDRERRLACLAGFLGSCGTAGHRRFIVFTRRARRPAGRPEGPVRWGGGG